MANSYWIGGALATTDVWTATVGGTVEIGDLFIVTVGQKSLSVAASSTSTSTTAGDITTAFNAASRTLYPEFNDINATQVSSTVVFAANDPGNPVVISVSTTEANGGAADSQTFAIVHTTSATGPNDRASAANYSGGLPGNGDGLWYRDSDIDALFGQLTATGLIVNVEKSFEGQLGLPTFNLANGYYEYRALDLQLDTPGSIALGNGASGRGSKLIHISANAAVPVTVYSSGQPLSGETAAVYLHASSGTMSLHQIDGIVYVGRNGIINSATALTPTLDGGTLHTGPLVTWAAAHKVSGSSSIIIDGAHTQTMTVLDQASVTLNSIFGTINLYSGSLDHRGANGVKFLVGGGGNLSLVNAAATVTLSGSLEILQGAVVNDSRSALASSTTVTFTGCNLSNTTCNFGTGRGLTLG